MAQHEICAEEDVDILNKEVEILKVKQQAHIQQQGNYQQQFHDKGLAAGCCAAPAHNAVEQIVYHNAGAYNQQIAGIEKSIKPQRHAQQEAHSHLGFFHPVQGKVHTDAARQEKQDKDIGIKQHIWEPFYRFINRQQTRP